MARTAFCGEMRIICQGEFELSFIYWVANGTGATVSRAPCLMRSNKGLPAAVGFSDKHEFDVVTFGEYAANDMDSNIHGTMAFLHMLHATQA